MSTTAEQYRAYRGPALFSMGFRPFFLFAAAWAALAIPIWIASFTGLLPAAQLSRDWHVHEMLFGYLGGVIAGFLLTAVPNWTGRLPVAGAPLAALFALWVTGRVAMLLETELGVLAAIIDSAFLFVLAAIVAREVLAGKNIRNLPVSLLISVLGVANVLTHLGSANAEIGLLGERIGLGVVSMLVALIGGRIVPSFTRNWMAKRKMTPEPASPGRFDTFTLALTAPALLGWIAAPSSTAAGAALTLAAVLHVVRLTRWRGWKTSAEPLVLVLHVGYAWLALAFFLIGLSILLPAAIPSSAGIHALTAGAFGVMTLAVMTRASLGHTGRPLTASPSVSLVYLLVNAAAAMRVLSPFLPEHYTSLLMFAAVLWSAAFAVFVIVYAPLLLSTRLKANA
jgi:uncharacterized protein involved in response to NO